METINNPHAGEIRKLQGEAENLKKIIGQINLAERNSYTAHVAKHFHLGTVGGSGRNTTKLNKRREAEVEKTIDNAVKYTQAVKRLGEVESRINFLENGGPEKREKMRSERNMALADWFKSLKVGDTYQPGNNPLLITKKNKKSFVTGNCTWTAAEVIGAQAAKLL